MPYNLHFKCTLHIVKGFFSIYKDYEYRNYSIVLVIHSYYSHFKIKWIKKQSKKYSVHQLMFLIYFHFIFSSDQISLRQKKRKLYTQNVM